MKTLNDSPRTHISIRVLAMVMCLMMAMSVMLFSTSTVAYCADETTPADPTQNAANAITEGVEKMANQIYTTMRAIATPITACIFAYAGFQFLIGGAQGTEKARKACFAGVGGLALIVFAPLIAQAVATWIKDSGTGDLGDYNPLK